MNSGNGEKNTPSKLLPRRWWFQYRIKVITYKDKLSCQLYSKTRISNFNAVFFLITLLPNEGFGLSVG